MLGAIERAADKAGLCLNEGVAATCGGGVGRVEKGAATDSLWQVAVRVAGSVEGAERFVQGVVSELQTSSGKPRVQVTCTRLQHHQWAVDFVPRVSSSQSVAYAAECILGIVKGSEVVLSSCLPSAQPRRG